MLIGIGTKLLDPKDKKEYIVTGIENNAGKYSVVLDSVKHISLATAESWL